MADPNVKQLGECPDSSLIAAYVDARLGESGRDTLHRHLAACDSCTELVAEIVAANEAALVPAAPPESSDQSAAHSAVLLFRRHRIVVASTLLAAAAVLALVVGVMLPQSAGEISSRNARRADPTVGSLAAALGGTRPIEGRLTDGWVRRGPHAWGVAQLLVGRYDASVETLESVLMQQRQDARVAADLGTARLARAGALDAPEDLPRALEAIEQALTLDPTLAEPWFTKAIVLERLQIRQQAREAWTTYLQLDPDSGWSAEARRRLAALESSTTMRPWRRWNARCATRRKTTRSFVKRCWAIPWKFASSRCARSCRSVQHRGEKISRRIANRPTNHPTAGSPTLLPGNRLVPHWASFANHASNGGKVKWLILQYSAASCGTSSSPRT